MILVGQSGVVEGLMWLRGLGGGGDLFGFWLVFGIFLNFWRFFRILEMFLSFSVFVEGDFLVSVCWEGVCFFCR